MATAFTLCTGPIAGAVSIGKGRVLVSVQGDGVSCYDISTQKPVASWALGGTEQDFSSAAVYDYSSNQCYAPVRSRGKSGGGGSVLAWPADDTAGSITQLALPLHLPALHSLFPVSHTPEGEAEEAAAAEAEERSAAEVDGSGERRGGALAVLTVGGLALCSSGEVVAEAEAARGQHTVAAAYQRGMLVLVTSDARSGAVSSTVCRVQGGKLECEPSLQLLPPSAGSRAVAATCTAERTAVLWSDGSVAVYLVPGDKQPLLRGPCQTGDSRQPAAQRQLGGYRLASDKQKGGSGAAAGKKRGAAGQAEVAAGGGVSMAAIGEKQVAVVGWASGSEGVIVLRLVVLETSAACVQLAQDFTAADVGLAVLDPSKLVQVESLGGSSGQLAISVGSAVLVATCSDLKLPTLANLLGALAVDKALAATRSSGGGGGGSDGSSSALLAVPAGAPRGALGGGGAPAALNPAALAAAQALHPQELARLCSPFGGAARPIEHSLVLQQPTEPGQWLVPAKQVVWQAQDPRADQRVVAEEQRVWQEVQQQPAAAALASDKALQQLLAPLLELRRSTGLPLSSRLICNLLSMAAERKHWGAAAAIAATQPPSMLGEVPGLAAAVADAGQFPLLEQLLYRNSDLPAAEVAALLQVLLSPPSSEAAQQGRQARHLAAEAAAAAAHEAALQAASGQAVQQQQQAEQQQAEQQSQPAGKAGRRPRRKAAAADSGGSDAEDLAAPMDVASGAGEQLGAAGPAAAAQQQQQQLPLVGAMAAPGARERAVATCCSAAVDGFAPADVCLHPLLLVRHRPAVLRQALRGLGALQAVQLLRYLAALLRTHAARVGSLAAGWQPALLLPPGVALPRLPEVLDWANCTLDANLIKLSMDPEAKPLLRELQKLVAAQIAHTQPLLRLGGIVEHLLLQQQQRAAPTPAASTADYSVQWLDLRIYPDGQQPLTPQQPLQVQLQ